MGDIDQLVQKHDVQFRSFGLDQFILLDIRYAEGDVGVVCNQLTKSLELKFLLSALILLS